MIDLFKHLLPRAKAFSITIDKRLRQLFEGLSESFDDAREFLDLVYFDLYPETTRHLTQWESQFGVLKGDLTEAERRTRLAGLWAARGGQDPRYIQDTLQGAGFDVYVHEWWELPAGNPPVARNPFTVLGGNPYGANDPTMEAGNLGAEAGNYLQGVGSMLVNKLYDASVNLTCLAGEAVMEAGNPGAEAGNNSGLIFNRRNYPIPSDPDLWPYIMYIGGETFGDVALVSAGRQEEFEDLCLKICPAHLWIGLLINFTNFLVEDESGDFLIEDESGDFLLE